MRKSNVRWNNREDTFIGTKFGPENQLEVVSSTGKSNNQRNTIYMAYCRICAEDSEMFADGLFKTTKARVKLGNLPCACNKFYRSTPAQYTIRVNRDCTRRNYTFHGYAGGEKPDKYTKLDLSCKDCGNSWDTTNLSSFLGGVGCPECGEESSRLSVTHEDSTMIAKFMQTGAFPSGSIFKRSNRLDSRGCRDYWDFICPVCVEDDYCKAGVSEPAFSASSGDLKSGKVPCRCSKNHRWSFDERVFQINSALSKNYNWKFSRWVEPYKNAFSKFEITCDLHTSWVTCCDRLLNANNGCPDCSKSGFNKSKVGWVYILKIKGTDNFVGYGISNVPKRRLSLHKRNLLAKGFTIEEQIKLVAEGWIVSKVEQEMKIKFVCNSQPVEGFITEATNYELFDEVVNFVTKRIEELNAQRTFSGSNQTMH